MSEPRPARSEVGRKAEDIAVRALKRAGYRILDRNLRLRAGEIDILARHGKVLAVVEVKSRAFDSDLGHPILLVNAAKQRKLRQLAKELQQRKNLTSTDFRFDVVTVDFTEQPPRVELMQGAFI